MRWSPGPGNGNPASRPAARGPRALGALGYVSRVAAVAGLMTGLIGPPAGAQCADGSAPPCRPATAPAGSRRTPPLDDQTWIVVPFDNVSGSQDAEWLRTGSVNLLYLGMSHWTDLRVIDDERVADYLRAMPGTSSSGALSLNDGLAVARRAGAGRLVMGEVIRLGNRTTVNAKVFDARTGRRLRTVRDETPVPDSLMSVFGALSRRLLNLPPVQGSGQGSVGTSSIAAYQEYVEGVRALNRFEVESVQHHLLRALSIDSGFALAHAKLAVVLGWVNPNDPRIRTHYEAAARLSGSLPQRERALIAASVAFARRDYPTSCAGFRALVEKDSTDTDAWYGLGDCLFHDTALEPVRGDTLRVRFRGSRGASVRAFRQALALDPTYHLAYQHIVDAYSAQFVSGSHCTTPARCVQYRAVVRPSGDSLLTIPLRLPEDTALMRAHLEEDVTHGTRRVALEAAAEVAERWVAANPSERRARYNRAMTALALGHLAVADSNLRLAEPFDESIAGINGRLAHLEVGIKQWRGVASAAAYDSLRASAVVITTTPAGAVALGNAAASAAPVFGRLSPYDSLVSLGASRGNTSPTVGRILPGWMRAVVGGMPEGFTGALSDLYDEVRARSGSAVATRTVGAMLAYAMRSAPPTAWPALDPTVESPLRVKAVAAVQRRDTAAIRHSAQALDSLSALYTSRLLVDSAFAIVAADAYLSVGDSVRALAAVRRWLDTTMAFTPIAVGAIGAAPVAAIVPRAMVLRADLAAGLGHRDEARTWYDRFLSMWERADPDLQPVVTRVRALRAALGPP